MVLVEEPARGFVMGFLTKEFRLDRGQGPDEATDTLSTAFAAAATRPVVLTSSAGKVTTTPKALGLRVDVIDVHNPGGGQE